MWRSCARGVLAQPSPAAAARRPGTLEQTWCAALRGTQVTRFQKDVREVTEGPPVSAVLSQEAW